MTKQTEPYVVHTTEPTEAAAALSGRRTEVLGHLFEQEIVRPSTPVIGYLCVLPDYTHPEYPGFVWSLGCEHSGRLSFSGHPLGTLLRLPPGDRLLARVVECAVIPDFVVGGGQGALEASRAIVTTEFDKPFGAYTESLRAFWASLRYAPRQPEPAAVVELVVEALLRFRLFGRFRCLGVSLVKRTVRRDGWTPIERATGGDWKTAWTAAWKELREARLRAMQEEDWQSVDAGVESLVETTFSGLPKLDVVRDHVLATSYAVAAGPGVARINPFAPLVSLAMMGFSALGIVGERFWLAAADEFAGTRLPLGETLLEAAVPPPCGQ